MQLVVGWSFALYYWSSRLANFISPVIANEQQQSWLVAQNDINRLMVTYGKVEGHVSLTGHTAFQMETI